MTAPGSALREPRPANEAGIESGGERRAATAVRRLFGDAPPWLSLFVTFQVVAILTASLYISLKATMLVGGDERAQVSYVETIVNQHRLPVENLECISEDLHRLQPLSPYIPCASPGGIGSSYEAFQPPLYYLVASPIFAVVPGLANKVYALRIFDVLLLAAGIAAFWWLAYEVLGRFRAYGFALGLCAFAIPALIVYQALVDNDALELPLAIAVLAACARAVRRPSERWSPWLAGGLFGALLLTKLTGAYLAVPFAAMILYRLWRERSAVGLRRAIVTALIPLAMLAPWLAYNEHRYHALTANSLAHENQALINHPKGFSYSWSAVPALDATIMASTMPRVCDFQSPNEAGEPFRDPAAIAVLALLILGPLMLARRRQGMASLFTIVPVGVEVAMLDVIYVSEQQFLGIARYLDPMLAPLLLGVALLVGGRSGQRRTVVAGLAVAVFVLALVLWFTRALPHGNVCTAQVPQ